MTQGFQQRRHLTVFHGNQLSPVGCVIPRNCRLHQASGIEAPIQVIGIPPDYSAGSQPRIGHRIPVHVPSQFFQTRLLVLVLRQEQAAAAPISQISLVAAVRQSLWEPVRHIIGHGGMCFEKFFCFFTPGKNHAIVLHRLRRLINVQPFPGRFPYDRGVIQAAILL